MACLGSGDGLTYHARLYLTTELWLILVLAVLAATPLFAHLGRHATLAEGWLTARFGRLSSAGSALANNACYLAILVLCLSFVAQKSYNPFIYFRF
jgi:hypothetical protein